MAATYHDLARYVPAYVQRRLQAVPGVPAVARSDRFPAALLFADISGFTRLASRLAELGPEGADELTRLLNQYYAPLVEIIAGHGGDIVRFAGDAVLAMWAAPADLPEAIRRATEAGLSVQQRLVRVEVAPEVSLSTRVSIGAGEVLAAEVGGVEGAWQLVVVGEPLDQIREADHQAELGDVVLSADACSLVAADVTGDRLAGGHLRVQELLSPTAPAGLELPPLDSAAQAALRAYVPRAVVARFDAGQFEWLAELRQVTVVFLRIDGIQPRSPQAAEQLQQVMHTLQHAMHRLQGTVIQLMADDKGTVGIVAFGLPPHRSEESAVRAVRAAREIHQELAGKGMRTGIGVATGRVFAGPLGSVQRSEYTIMGEAVNLAARLMQQARDDILASQATAEAAHDRLAFHHLPPFLLKGFAEPVAVFRPKPVAGAAAPAAIVGRQCELDAILAAVAEVRSGENRVVLIEGEPGIGKSSLSEAALARAAELGLRPLAGQCSAIEQTTPYFPWRQVYQRLLGLEGLPDRGERRQRVQAAVQRTSPLVKLAPLLNPVLDVDLPENEIVTQLTGQTRADNLHDLLTSFVRRAAREQPLLILLDDVQWLDSVSWRLASLMLQRATPVLLMLVMRPIAEPAPVELTQLQRHPGARKLHLELLDRGATADLVRRHLGVGQLDAVLEDYIWEQSQGNPFFAEELASFLRDGGTICVADGVCRLVELALERAAAVVPGTIREVVTSRIDQLALPEQLTLKTASVIGRVFEERALESVYPVEPDRPNLPTYLDHLDQHDLTRLEARDPDPTYRFKHLTIQQVAYDQLPRAQRRALHQAIARWYEADGEVAPRLFPRLAWHWGQAEVPEKEVEYLARAGEEAFRAGANREVVTFLREALQRHSRLPEADRERNRLLRAHWIRLLGDAHFKLGELREAQSRMEEALELLGHHVPQRNWHVLARTLWQLAVQIGHRLRPVPVHRPAPVADEVSLTEPLQEAALALQRLSQVHYFTNEMLPGTYCALAAMNTGERFCRSPGLARSYANMAIVNGLLRWHRIAQRYADLAEEVGRDTGHRPSLCYALVVGGMYRMGVAQWERVGRDAEEAVALAEELGDQRLLAEAVTVQAILACFVGRFAAGSGAFERVRAIGQWSGNGLHQAWGWCGRAECEYRRGRIEAALEMLATSARILEGNSDRTEEIRAHGLLAAAHWRFGQRRAALRHATKAMERIADFSLSTCSTLEGFAGVAEVLLEHWRDAPEDSVRRARARQALAHLAGYAKVFPIGRPRLLRLKGRMLWIENHPLRAVQCWQRSLAAAQSLALEMEAGLARLELAVHLAPSSPDRQEHLARALADFERLEMAWETQHARSLWDSSMRAFS